VCCWWRTDGDRQGVDQSDTSYDDMRMMLFLADTIALQAFSSAVSRRDTLCEFVSCLVNMAQLLGEGAGGRVFKVRV
jgi:hypothetical protein